MMITDRIVARLERPTDDDYLPDSYTFVINHELKHRELKYRELKYREQTILITREKWRTFFI